MVSRMIPGEHGPIEWVGPVSVDSLNKVLRRISTEERSGDLQVICERCIKAIYFDQGSVVFAASNVMADRLGECMLQHGCITEEQFALASDLMKPGRLKFGQALVHAGVLSEEELSREVSRQMSRIIQSLFMERGGIYSFDERSPTIPEELMVKLSTDQFLLDTLLWRDEVGWTLADESDLSDGGWTHELTVGTDSVIASYSRVAQEAADDAPAGVSRSAEVSSDRLATRSKQLLRDAMIHFEVRDWAGALPLLFELVELNPINARYRGLLGKAMSRQPVMQKNAERHFLEALRLAPENPELHLWAGQYYLALGVKSRAEAEFRTVLDLEPGHSKALKYLSEKKERQPFLSLFRRIFS